MFTPDVEAYSSLLSSALAVIRIIQRSTDCPSSSKAQIWLDLCSRYRQISHKPWQPRKLRWEISPGAAKNKTYKNSASNLFLTSMKTKPRLSGHSICFSSKDLAQQNHRGMNLSHMHTKRLFFFLKDVDDFIFVLKKTISLKDRYLWPTNSQNTVDLAIIMC